MRAGERLAILGANGSGKSTLLKLFAGLAFAETGEVRFRGQALTPRNLERPDFQRAFRQRVGLVFQNSDVQLFCATAWDEIASRASTRSLASKPHGPNAR